MKGIPRRPLAAQFKRALLDSGRSLEQLSRDANFVNVQQLRDLLAAPDVRCSSEISAAFARAALAIDFDGDLFERPEPPARRFRGQLVRPQS